jgi:hypothetical protein
MFPAATRDLAKSVTNCAWALSVFATQQGLSVITGWKLEEATEAFEQVNKSMNCGCAGRKQTQTLRRPAEPVAAAGIPKPPYPNVVHFPGMNEWLKSAVLR